MNASQEHFWIAGSFRRDTEYPDSHIRILHFPCGTGDLLAYLGALLRPAVTYGASPTETVTASITTNHFCAVSSLEEVRMSRRAFDLVILDLDRIPQKSRTGNIRKARGATSGDNYTVLLFSEPLSQDELRAASQDIQTGSESESWEVLAVRLTSGRNALVLRTPQELRYTDEDGSTRRNTAAANRIARALLNPVSQRDFKHEFKIRPWLRHSPPVFSPMWLDADHAARVIASFGPWKDSTPPEYLDEDPATPELRPAMPLRRGHLALAAVSGAMGVLKVTVRGRPAALCGRVAREEQASTEKEGSVSTTTTSQSFKPEITILFLDNMELLRA